MNVTTATAQGTRTYQEDRFFVHPTEHGTLFAVLDGHGGDETAAVGARALPRMFDEAYAGFPEQALKSAIQRLDLLTGTYTSGSTLSAVFLPTEGSAAFAILGDSPVIADIGDAIHISPDHNVRTNPKELDAAIKRGGYYLNGYICNPFGNGLQMARALGDARLRPIVIQEPEIYSLAVRDFLILASDGVFDPGHGNTAKEIEAVVGLVRSGAEAQDLVDRAIKNRTGDNATAIVVRR